LRNKLISLFPRCKDSGLATITQFSETEMSKLLMHKPDLEQRVTLFSQMLYSLLRPEFDPESPSRMKTSLSAATKVIENVLLPSKVLRNKEPSAAGIIQQDLHILEELIENFSSQKLRELNKELDIESSNPLFSTSALDSKIPKLLESLRIPPDQIEEMLNLPHLSRAEQKKRIQKINQCP
jgi:hypothetical protein